MNGGNQDGGQGRRGSLFQRALVDLGVAAVALALGFGVFAVVSRGDGPSSRSTNDPNAFTASTAPAGSALPTVDGPVVAATDGGAPSAREAIDGYLEAEVSGDLAAAYLMLSSPDRTVFPTEAKWERVHADRPTITAYEITSFAEAPDHASAMAASDLDLVPTLNEVVGLVAARASATWTVVREGDVWRVSLAQSTLSPVWPAATAAPGAVADWARARQSCDSSGPSAGEFSGGLLGSPPLADALCDTAGSIAVGDAEPLSAADAAQVIAAFGDDAQIWARVVDVSGPADLRAVAAPLGDTWIVVAVLPPAS